MRNFPGRLALAALLLAVTGQQALAGDLVLVAGATGGTGRQIVSELNAAGYRVRAFVRDADSARAVLGKDVEYATGDVRQRPTIDAAMLGVRYVIVAIGATRKDPANGPEFVDYQGVRNLAEAAAAGKADQMVLVSSFDQLSDHTDQLNAFLLLEFRLVLILKFQHQVFLF